MSTKLALVALASTAIIATTQACGFAAPFAPIAPVATVPVVTVARPVAWGYANNNCCANTCGGFNSPWRVWNEDDSNATTAHDDEMCEEDCDPDCECEDPEDELENESNNVNVFDLDEDEDESSSDSLCWDDVEEESTSCEDSQ